MMLGVRGGRGDEADLVAQIHEAAVRAAYGHIFAPVHSFPTEETRRRWRGFGGRIVVAEMSGVPLTDSPGAAPSASPQPTPDNHALYVLPEYWGRGVGARLLEAAGPVRELWVLHDYLRARHFYEKHGWLPDGAEQAPDGASELRYRLTLPSVCTAATPATTGCFSSGSSESVAPALRTLRHDRGSRGLSRDEHTLDYPIGVWSWTRFHLLLVGRFGALLVLLPTWG